MSYLGHALVENRNGLIAAAMVTHADGYAERDAALLMLAEKQQGRARRITVGADKAYDTKDFVSTVRELNVTPHVTKNDKGRSSNLDRRTTRQPGYAISLSRRWLIEKGFGWLKQTGPLRQVKLRGLEKVDWLFVFSCAAHNLIRLPRLMAQPPGNAPAAVCLNGCLRASGMHSLRSANPYKQWPQPHFKQISNRARNENHQERRRNADEFQRVPRLLSARPSAKQLQIRGSCRSIRLQSIYGRFGGAGRDRTDA